MERGFPRRPTGLGALLLAAGAALLVAAPAFLPASAAGRSTPTAEAAEARYEVDAWRAVPGRATAPAVAAPGIVVRRGAAAGEGSSAVSAWRTAAAALCLLAAARFKPGRGPVRRGRSVVALRVFPSCCHRPKQKVLRRLEPYGQIPAWSRRPLIVRRKKKTWQSRAGKRPSNFGRFLIEKQRVRFHYNVKEYQLRKYMRLAYRKGIDYPVDNFLQQLESRLDNYVWRVGLAPTMAGARHFVKEGHIQWKNSTTMKTWRVVNVPSFLLKIGDQVRVNKKNKASQNYGKLNQEDEGPVPVPAHITWDREDMSGTYDDICDRHDFGLNVEERFITLYYSGQSGRLGGALRRRHIRYFEGTSKVIKKGYNGGRIRPTPENILNLKQGIGLNKRGRARPPCLWGRKKPLNSPYEKSNRPAQGVW
mmetsp:Transcript_103535/g.221421  ORF Transcript_103535/g.221421 Transcript_103535/m.221421 type:complete len:420 (-) Transcript_103535:93-1352(-)